MILKSFFYTLLCSCLLSTTLVCSSSHAENTKNQDIMLMLRLSGQLESSEQIISAMVPQLIQLITASNPNLPKSEINELMSFLESVLKQEVPRLLDMLVPIYAKHFTHEDIQGLIKFYQSPLGSKLVQKQKLVLPESMKVGEIWGQQVAQKAIQDGMAKIRK